MQFGEYRKQFSIAHIFLSIVLIISSYSLVLSIGFLFALESNRDFVYGVLGLCQFAFMGGLVYFISHYVPIEKRSLFRFNKPLGGSNTILWTIIGFFGLYIFTSGIIPIQNSVLPDSISSYLREFYSDYIERYKQIFGVANFYNIFYSLLAIAIAPAIFEELAFRGFFLKTFEQHLSENKSIIIVSLLFALIHFSFETFIPLFAASLLLGKITIRANSIFPAMLVHFLLNASSIIAFYFALDLIESSAINDDITLLQIFLYFGMCLIGIAIMFLSYRKIARGIVACG